MKHEQRELELEDKGISFNALVSFLNDGASKPVDVKLTSNKVTMLSIDHSRVPHLVRMHRKFLYAPEDVLSSLRTYIRKPSRKDWKRVSDYARSITVTTQPKRQETIRHKGEVYDLLRLAKEVNREYFNGKVSCSITWGRKRPDKGKRWRRARSIRFGSWVESRKLIRIHPALDSRTVPVEFVMYIIYHEMLHAVVPATKKNGRRYDHTAQFRKLERAYPEFGRMQKIAAKIVSRLN